MFFEDDHIEITRFYGNEAVEGGCNCSPSISAPKTDKQILGIREHRCARELT